MTAIKKFKKTYIEITNACNLSCSFCPKTKRPVEFMSCESFEEILFKLQNHSKYIYFHVMGEPLLHPEIDRFLELSHDYGFKVNITTNGTLINKASDKIISKPALRQVNFSLHSFKANSIACTMEAYLDNIFSFIQMSQRSGGISICLRLWNLTEKGRNDRNEHILRRIEHEFSLDYAIEEKLTPCNGIRLAQNIFLNQASEFEWPDSGLEEIGSKGFCYGLRDQVAILVDGTVVPCCLDREGAISLGNIFNQSFQSITESERAVRLYEGFSNRNAVEELCRKCGYRTRFGT